MNEINKALEALRRAMGCSSVNDVFSAVGEAMGHLSSAAAADAGAEDALERTMIERDFREDVINAILDEVLGLDRAEWSSNYDFNDAVSDVKERMWALAKPAPAAASERRSFEQLAAEFDPWWERSGQFCRAGGGGYEKTFAFYAWHAALEMAGVKLPSAGQCGESCERAKLCGACARGLEEVPEPAASEREAFEAWARDQWGDRPVPNNAWLGWQGRAALAASQPAPVEAQADLLAKRADEEMARAEHYKERALRAEAQAVPASFPGAARGLAESLARIAEKCRPGYVVSKTVRAQLDEAATVARVIAMLAAAPTPSMGET